MASASANSSSEGDHLGAFYCHTCERRIHAVFHPRDEEDAASSSRRADRMADAAVSDEMDDQPTCPHCGAEFVERLEEEEQAPTPATPLAAPITPAVAPNVAPATTFHHQTFHFGGGGGVPGGGLQFLQLGHPFMQRMQSMMQPQMQPQMQPAQVHAAQAQAQAAAALAQQQLQALFGFPAQAQAVPPQQPAMPGVAPTAVSGGGDGEQLLPAHPSPQQAFQFGFQSIFPPQIFGAGAPLAGNAAAFNSPPQFQQLQQPQQQPQPGQAPPQPLQQHFQLNLNPFAQLFPQMQPNVQPAQFFPFGAQAGANPFGAMFQQLLGLPFAAGGGAAAPPGQFGDVFGGDINQLLHHLMMQGSGRSGSPPASAASVAALQDITLDEAALSSNANSDCAVCLEVFAAGEVVKQLGCGHRYHPDCLLPWLREHNSCPTCRFLLPTDDPAYEQRRAQAAQALLEQQAQHAHQVQTAASSQSSSATSASAPSPVTATAQHEAQATSAPPSIPSPSLD